MPPSSAYVSGWSRRSSPRAPVVPELGSPGPPYSVAPTVVPLPGGPSTIPPAVPADEQFADIAPRPSSSASTAAPTTALAPPQRKPSAMRLRRWRRTPDMARTVGAQPARMACSAGSVTGLTRLRHRRVTRGTKPSHLRRRPAATLTLTRAMPRILDVEQAMLLLEIEAPFDQRAVQLARRRMAKRWHPDIAPPGRQHEHQRHLQAINEAADQLEQLAETVRGGRVSRNAVKVSAAAARKRPRGGGPPRLRGRAAPAGRRAGAGAPRSVRRACSGPLRRPPLRALPVLPGVGGGHGERHLLLRRG